MNRLLIIILICTFAFAQDKVTSVEKGSTAVLFSFSGLDNLNANTINGGVGGKYFITSDFAVRVGARINGFTEKYPANPDATELGIDGEYSTFTFGFNAAIEWHLTASRVSPYLGGGIGYSNTSTDFYPSVTWDINNTGPVDRTTTERSGVGGFSIFGIAGVEVFIIKEISLSAEYHFAYATTSAGEVKETIVLFQGVDPAYPRSRNIKGNETSSYGFETAGFLTIALYF